MYEPQEDSFLLKDCVLEFLSGNSTGYVLDMGTGSGIQAFSVVDKAEFVLAADLSPDAVAHVKREIIKKGLSDKVEAIKSDLFSSIPNRFRGKFNLIIFNAPYLPKAEEDFDDDELYGGEDGFLVTKRFLVDAKIFLAPEATIFFVASSLAKVEEIERTMKNLGYDFEMVKKQHIFFEDIIVYKAQLKP